MNKTELGMSLRSQVQLPTAHSLNDHQGTPPLKSQLVFQNLQLEMNPRDRRVEIGKIVDPIAGLVMVNQAPVLTVGHLGNQVMVLQISREVTLQLTEVTLEDQATVVLKLSQVKVQVQVGLLLLETRGPHNQRETLSLQYQIENQLPRVERLQEKGKVQVATMLMK
jgi:hypothetical protein